MKIDKKSMLVGGIAAVAIISAIYIGNRIYLSGDSGVSRASACSEMRGTMRDAQTALADNPDSRELIKAATNLQAVYARTCL